MQSDSLIYVANAGVLINVDGKKVLIDGLNSADHPLYRSTPAEITEQIIEGIAPYDNIDVMLITHNHSDHFDVERVAGFLEKSTDTVVISTYETIAAIKNHSNGIVDARLISLQPEHQCMERVQVKGLDIMAFSLVHDGKEFTEVDNLAFLIDSGKRILHLGDGAPAKENFEMLNLQKYNIDVLIANFPYISLPSARLIIEEYIKPQKIVVVHMPDKEKDRFGWIKTVKKNYDRIKGNFFETEFLEDIGASIEL